MGYVSLRGQSNLPPPQFMKAFKSTVLAVKLRHFPTKPFAGREELTGQTLTTTKPMETMGPARGSWNRSKRFPTPHRQQQVDPNGAIGFRCFSSTIEGHVTFGDFEGARKGCSKTISVIEVIGFEIILKKILAKCAILPLKVKIISG